MTASEAYKAQRIEVYRKFKELDNLIGTHEAEAKQEGIHYGHIGDLQHVESIIEQAIKFLKEED